MARQDTAYAYGQPLWLPSKRACPQRPIRNADCTAVRRMARYDDAAVNTLDSRRVLRATDSEHFWRSDGPGA
jgi:hypothetical protein